MAFEYIFFDFDGTVFDTSPGIYNSFDYLIEKLNLDFDKSQYYRMIGPPLAESYEKIMGIPKDQIPHAIEVYRDYYAVKGLFECEVYEGVVELIQALRKEGKKIFVATSKPEEFARAILERKNMAELFDFIGGSDMAEKARIEKIDVIRYVLEQNGIETQEKLNRCLMIGDRYFDVEGAHMAGMKCCGILWGFGSREEFIQYHADYIEETPEAVKNLILNSQ